VETSQRTPSLLAVVLVFAILVVTATHGLAADDDSYPYMNEYPLPAGAGAPEELAVASPGHVWFTLPNTNRVGELVVTSPGNYDIKHYPLPPGSSPRSIAVSGGYAWVTASGRNSLLRVAPGTGAYTEYLLPAGSQPAGIAVAPNGNVWIAAPGANKILRFSPSTPNSIGEYSYPEPDAGITEIAVHNDDAIYFTAVNRDEVVRLSPLLYPQATAFTALPLANPKGSLGAPGKLAVNQSGDIWVVAVEPDWLLRWTYGTFSTWHVNEVPPAGADIFGLALSRLGTTNVIWFTLPQAGLVGHLGQGAEGLLFLREHGIPTAGSVPRSIAVDSNNHAWIAVAGSNRIAEWLPDYSLNVYLPVVGRN
jgi:virginiamycin B lyase